MSIFDELNIDYNLALSNPALLNEQVHTAAKELTDKLRANISVKDYIKELPKSTNDFSDFDGILNAVYAVTDDYAVEDLQELATKVRELANTISHAAKVRAAQELAIASQNIDKPKTHRQYVELRDTFNKLVDMVKVLKSVTMEKLPPMPGNYNSAANLVTVMFVNGDTATANYLTVQKALNLTQMSLVDMIEYIDANPDCGWTYTKVKL